MNPEFSPPSFTRNAGSSLSAVQCKIHIRHRSFVVIKCVVSSTDCKNRKLKCILNYTEHGAIWHQDGAADSTPVITIVGIVFLIIIRIKTENWDSSRISLPGIFFSNEKVLRFIFHEIFIPGFTNLSIRRSLIDASSCTAMAK